jgi:hypothetical protein
MAISLAAATIGAAVLGAGASALSSSKNSKAINQATTAQTAATDQNNALQRDIYGQNKETLSPFVQGGVAANSALNSMLGLGSFQPQQMQPMQQQFAQPQAWGQQFGQPQAYGRQFDDFGDGYGRNRGLGQFMQQDMQYGQPQPMQQMQAMQTAQANPWDGFKKYLEGSDYAFQFDRGANAVNSGYAGAGTVKSGAAMKGLEQFRQGLQAGYRNEYTGLVGQQQGVGLQAAGAQAGVGVNYANATSANNTANANNQAQAAIARANNSNATLGSFANIGSNVLGYFGGR